MRRRRQNDLLNGDVKRRIGRKLCRQAGGGAGRQKRRCQLGGIGLRRDQQGVERLPGLQTGRQAAGGNRGRRLLRLGIRTAFRGTLITGWSPIRLLLRLTFDAAVASGGIDNDIRPPFERVFIEDLVNVLAVDGDNARMKISAVFINLQLYLAAEFEGNLAAQGQITVTGLQDGIAVTVPGDDAAVEFTAGGQGENAGGYVRRAL